MPHFLDISLAYDCVGECVYMSVYKEETVSEGLQLKGF